MSETSVATEKINTFLLDQEGFASPSDVFILNADQLQQILQKAHNSIVERLSYLEGIVATQNQELCRLKALQETDTQHLAKSIAQDRKRLAALEKVEPQPMQMDRGEILIALIAANGGKMLAKDARQKMHLRKNRFSELLDTLKDDIEVKPLHSDKRKQVLKLVPRN